MNERIRKLLVEFKEVESQHRGMEVIIGMDEINKFAELIVKECVEQCSKALVEHTGQPSVTHNYAVGLCQDNIKEHFGVEL